jgi:hypothetical protein
MTDRWDVNAASRGHVRLQTGWQAFLAIDGAPASCVLLLQLAKSLTNVLTLRAGGRESVRRCE